MRRGRTRVAGALAGLPLVAGMLLGVPTSTAVAEEATVPCAEAAPALVERGAYAFVRFNLAQVWQIATGSGVKVAVVDSGVDSRNVHLRDAVLPGVSFLSGYPGDGREDVQTHGTAVASIIAARQVEGSGVIGIAPEAQILPVRVYYVDSLPNEEKPPPDLAPNTVRLADGIRWAADNGAQVINVSMSTGPDDKDLAALHAAVRYAARQDAVIVASAGNLGDDGGDGIRYPAGFPEVIGVGASNDYDFVDKELTVQGPQVDVVAPGQSVPIAYGNRLDCVVGNDKPYTSYATPYVSGLAALLRERFPEESAKLITYRIQASADRPQRKLKDENVTGWGLIQPYTALTMTLDPKRPGPPFPGASESSPVKTEASIKSIAADPDPLPPARRELLWWVLAGSGLVGLAFVLRPWTARRTRPTSSPASSEPPR